MRDLISFLDWFSMNGATCSALTALFPLVLITAVLERREMALKLRLRGWFRTGLLAVVSTCLLGLALAIGGGQAGGLRGLWAIAAWACTAATVLGLGSIILASMASTEVAEDQANNAPGG